jgi:hypothetical protein
VNRRSASRVLLAREALTPELASIDDALFTAATRYLGVGAFEDDGFVPSSEAADAVKREARSIRARVDASSVPLGLEPFVAHLAEACDWLETTVDDDRDFPVNPLRSWIAALQRRLFSRGAQDEPEGRSRFLLARLRRADDFLSALVDGAAQAPAIHLEHCLRRLAPLDDDLARGATCVRDLPDADALVDALERARAAVARCGERLRAAIATPREIRLRCTYEDVVARKFGFDLDDIRGWCDDECEAARERLADAVGGSGPDAVRYALKTRLTRYPDRDALRSDAEHALASAREVARARVALPDGEQLRLGDVPDTDRDKLPFGAYEGGDVLRGDVRGRWLLNMSNLRGVHRGWVWIMALHEGYPGHHAHYVMTAVHDALPRTFRLPGYGPSQGLVEGVAHRSEAYLETFKGQRDLWPMVPYRRLQTLLRIKTQLMISVERRPHEEAVAVYERSLGMDGGTASALVRSQAMNPGRTFSYYTGMRTLRASQRRLGVHDAAFTESILSNGFVSLATIRKLLEQRYGTGPAAGGPAQGA